MGYSKDYTNVQDWQYKDTGYHTGATIKYNGNIFKADFWAQAEPGKKPKPAEGWALFDELYDVTSSISTPASKVIAYLPTWRKSENFPYSSPATYKSVTHVIISFLMFNFLSIGQLDQTSINDVKAILPDVLKTAHAQGVYVMVAVGGATDFGFNNLMAAIGSNANSPLIEKSARAIADFVNENKLDGVDLDLECWWDKNGDPNKDQGGRMRSAGPHPAGSGLTLLAKRLRELMPNKLISAAFPGTSWYGNNFDPSIHQYLDWIGLMTYDFTGSWNASPVGPHSALYKIKDQSIFKNEQQGEWPGGGMENNPIISVEESLWYWTNPYYSNWQGEGAKIPRNKIALGTPTYGYDFAYAKDADDLSGDIPPGFKAIRYKDLIKDFPSASVSLNANIKVSGNTARPSFIKAAGSYPYKNNIYYETPQNALEKLNFSKRVGCQGLIVWELTNDAVGSSSIIDRLFQNSGSTDVRKNNIKAMQLNSVDGFYMAIISDTQWAWTNVTDDGGSESEDQKNSRATKLNNDHVTSINKLSDQLFNVKGTIINGDLTAFGHSNEFDNFSSIWSKLKVPKYMGLGNHDYANNVDDCAYNECANRMVRFMLNHIKSFGFQPDLVERTYYEFPSLKLEYSGSLAYSWDIDNVHFVQLHNFPLYKRSWRNFLPGEAREFIVNIKDSLNWLENDLTQARKAGKAILLNFHDSEEHWADRYLPDEASNLKNKFISMIKLFGVSAVFCGHFHKIIGQNGSYDGIPIFYSGSVSQSKYLIVQFSKSQMTVNRVSSLNGAADQTLVGTYNLITEAKDVQATPRNGEVTFFNEGGYVARFNLKYTLNSQESSFDTGDMSLGNKKAFTIPGGATSIKVRGENNTGLVWAPVKTIFDETLPGVTTICFKSYGTTLDPKYSKDC